MDRRQFLELASLGAGVVFVSGLASGAERDVNKLTGKNQGDFFFVQLSDTHWGYRGDANPDAENTLRKSIASVNALPVQPDFVVFTGDLTHTTDDPVERRKRMQQFREIVSALRVRDVRFMPGEHDASLDAGQAFIEWFGAPHYVFNHKGVHFIVLDNVSDPGASIGEAQLAWLKADLASLSKDARIVVFKHRTIFDLEPKWDWATRDGAKALELLMPYTNVTVFYGHIHQENHHMTGHIAHHSCKSLIFPLPAPGSQPKRAPLPWDEASPYKGLGFREVAVSTKAKQLDIEEYPVTRA